jgi:hypothetical protein
MAWKDFSVARKVLNLGFGALLFFGGLWILSPLVTRPIQMLKMCRSFQVGQPKSDVDAQVLAIGFRSVERLRASGQSFQLVIYDVVSLGKTSCVLDVGEDRVLGSKFTWSDTETE